MFNIQTLNAEHPPLSPTPELQGEEQFLATFAIAICS